MRRSKATLGWLGAGALAIAGIAASTSAFAQTAPAPPTTFYGSASGAIEGQSVVAFVINAGQATACGSGTVQDDEEAGLVYVVDVEQNGTIAGCGATGRQIRLYFPPKAGGKGAFATPTVTWQPAGAYEHDVTLGAQLANRQVLPGLSRQP